MKKGGLHFWSRKKQSLFGSNIKIEDMDNVELVLNSAAIPESGTASVRARPTVNHHTASYESFQGFAVPTPKVPLLPPGNGPKINGSVAGNHLFNGSVQSLPNFVEEDLCVPPPPSSAPPPPPLAFIPPPDFMGDLNSLDLADLQPTSMSETKMPFAAPYMEEEDLTILKPPPMAPPKPPSTSSNHSSVPISSQPPAKVPEHPTFSPPQPPSERLHKTPPPKPIRLSSISNLDFPPEFSAPPPPVQTPTLSTFNPQNTAKMYDVPKTSILKRQEDLDTRPKQTLLLQDSVSIKSAPVPVQVDAIAPKVATPSEPVSKSVQEPKEHLQITQPSHTLLPEPIKEAKTVPAPPIDKPLRIQHQTSPQFQKTKSTLPNQDKLEGSPSQSQSQSFSPLLDRKLRNLKSNETTGTGHVASPLALLMAAKERDRYRSTHTLSRENSAKKNEQPSASIHPSDSSPNSFIVTPRSSTPSPLPSQERIQESPRSFSHLEHTQTIHTPEKSSSPVLVKDQKPSSSSILSRMAASASSTSRVSKEQNAEPTPIKSLLTQHDNNKSEFSIPFLPPPPEFDDLDEIMEPPPSMKPPDPPMKKAPTPSPPRLPLAPVPPLTPSPPPPPPPPPPKIKLPAAPKLPPPDFDVKPKPKVQTLPKMAPNQPPSNMSASQATLLSILQKKMMEMDHKMDQVNISESTSDDWGAPLSDEDNKAPVVHKATPQGKSYPVFNKAATLDMKEVESKVARKYQESSSVKIPTSNGHKSRHKYGMTFTVRPGTKQPITLVSQGEAQ